MPQLTLDVTIEVAARLRAAYNVETNADLKAAIIRQIKEQLRQYETQELERLEEQKVLAALEVKRQAVAAKESEVKQVTIG
jgi:predicted nucleotide-binding protein (sugar kinase/HSP70/actin superfamily)